MKKNRMVTFCLLLVFLLLAIPHMSLSGGSVRLHFFYSDQKGGTRVKDQFIEPLSKRYPIEIQSFSVDRLDHYNLLVGFEKELKKEGNELPVVMLGENILGGEDQIRKDLEALVKVYAERGGTPWLSLQVTKTKRWIPHEPTEEEKASRKIIYGAFFYTSGCLDCEGKRAELEEWVSHFPDLRIATFDLTKDENKTLDEALCQIYHVPESRKGILRLYMGQDYLGADHFRFGAFQELVSKYQGHGASPPWEKVPQEALKHGEERIIERFKKFSLSAVLMAGFIDGINPCAFATIIFLVSYLTFAGKKKLEILLYGIVFTGGVFMAYLLAGMGLMAGLRQLNGFPLITKGIYLVVSTFAFALGVISLYDYVLFRRGRIAEWKLQLPMALKKRVHRAIREGVGLKKKGVLAAFGLGFVIAGTEVVCTGQVYLPTIGYIMSIPKLRVHAFFHLLLYNIMFIIPLAGVFTAVFFGVSSERLALVSRKYTGAVKLLTAILFIGLGTSLFILR